MVSGGKELERMMIGAGREDDPLGGRMDMVSGFSMQVMPAVAVAGEMVGTSSGSGGGGGEQRREDKMPQWGIQETRDLIAIRAELERDLTVSRRNKTLWEAAALRMMKRGYHRTSDQCKCRWKNLVNGYKGKEAFDSESGRHCPFFEELHAVFVERTGNIHESGATRSKKRSKRPNSDLSSDEFPDDNDDDEDNEQERMAHTKKKKAVERLAFEKSKTANNIHDLLREFLQQQQQFESHWWEVMDRRAHERQRFEQEWRQSLEKLERERLMLEQAWREREEQRRMREESRSEKRDALITSLLSKLIRNDL